MSGGCVTLLALRGSTSWWATPQVNYFFAVALVRTGRIKFVEDFESLALFFSAFLPNASWFLIEGKRRRRRSRSEWGRDEIIFDSRLFKICQLVMRVIIIENLHLDSTTTETRTESSRGSSASDDHHQHYCECDSTRKKECDQDSSMSVYGLQYYYCDQEDSCCLDRRNIKQLRLIRPYQQEERLKK